MFQMELLQTLGWITAFTVVVVMIIAKTRNHWDPPKAGKGTPRYSKSGKTLPVTHATKSPMVIRGKTVGQYVDEEVEDFHDFLKNVEGSVNTKSGKHPISKTQGCLLSWSYKPFREGNWWDMIKSGLKKPEFMYFMGTPSLIPNPAGNTPESPLTMVTAEEDLLRCVGGESTVRVFYPNQPTFPKFNNSEHGDMVCKKMIQKIKGEEFVLGGGDVLAIPRGWAYRIKLHADCVACFRIPIHSILTYIS